MNCLRSSGGRASNRFAVDGNGPGQRGDVSANSAPEDLFELLRVQQTKDSQESPFQRNAVLQRQKTAQPIFHRRDPEGDVVEVINSRKVTQMAITRVARRSYKASLLGFLGYSIIFSIFYQSYYAHLAHFVR